RKGPGINSAVVKIETVLIVRLRRAVAAQERMYSRRELTQAKRLGHIVVGTQFQADNLVHLLPLGGKHKDQALIFPRAKLLADIVSAQPRQHNIEHDERRAMFLYGIQRLIATRTGLNRKAFAGQELHQSKADI